MPAKKPEPSADKSPSLPEPVEGWQKIKGLLADVKKGMKDNSPFYINVKAENELGEMVMVKPVISTFDKKLAEAAKAFISEEKECFVYYTETVGEKYTNREFKTISELPF